MSAEQAPGERESPKAAEAFAIYVGLGPGRSLTNLAHVLTEQNRYKTRTTARNAVATWSVKHRWQERLAAAITARTEAALARANEIDAQTFARTSELLAQCIATVEPDDLEAVLKVRESVRRPEPRGVQAVNLNLSVALRKAVEREAAEQGLDPEEVLAEAERILEEGG